MTYRYPTIDLAYRPGEQLAFLGPFPISATLPSIPGVYAVLYRERPLANPNVYTIMYVGQSVNLAERGFPRGHHAFTRWLQVAGNPSNIFIAILPMQGYLETVRRQVEQDMIAVNNPRCNNDPLSFLWK